MCGIVGIVSIDRERPVSRARLQAMRDVLTHRGPDGCGLMAEGRVGLGHRRLAIVDVAGGHQPMANESRTVWTVFNGEIYNHLYLRRDLEERGHRYKTRSDTESIVHLYEEYGPSGIDRLQGMFAFAIWDVPRRRLLLVRDRLGIKPLYYAVTQREILFASEIKALLAAGVEASFDRAVLPEFLANRYVAGDRTFFAGIRRVPPGHLLTWSADEGVRQTRYWQVPAVGQDRSPASLEERAHELLAQLRAAVTRHLMSDVPLGVFLSGGLDSSALAALAAPMVDGPLQTFAVGFHEAGVSELPYAARVAAAIGADHHAVRVTPHDFFAALPSLIRLQDEPMAFSSGVPLYFVSRLAQSHVKVVLTGEGADELLLGYNRYRVSYWNDRLGGGYAAATGPAVRAGVRRLMRRLPARLRRYGDRTFLALEPGPRAMFDNFAVFPERLQGELLRAHPADDPHAFALERYAEAAGDVRDRLSATDLQSYLGELLTKQDRMSMAASIESRVPFLDDALVEHLTAMPAPFKLRGWTSKAVLRRAVAPLLPAEILTRRKMGFPVPLGRWLRTSHWPVVEEFVQGTRAAGRGLFDLGVARRLAAEHRAGRRDHTERLWLLISLEIWQRIYCDDELPGEVLGPIARQLETGHAHSVDQDGRTAAAQHWRSPSDLPDSFRADSAS